MPDRLEFPDEPPPIILFGAFDRHNLGDLLFPHVAAALLGERDLVFAGLVERDMRPFGGHRVVALTGLAAAWGDVLVDVVHVGGEILDCDAWQAAVMTLAPDQAQAAITAWDGDARGQLAWAQRLLGIKRRAAYVAPKGLFQRPGMTVFNGVGGVGLAGRAPEFRAEIVASLKAADYVGVRDRITLEWLLDAGIDAHLMPDPAVMVATLFSKRIRRHGENGEVADVRRAFPRGYVAVQFSADFGDDATLDAIASELDRVTAEAGLAVVLFRAGAAPWHDDLECYRRAAARMKTSPVRVFESLNIWDICALIAGSRGYCGSSLHGRIVAMAFGLPGVNILHPGQAENGAATKQGAFAQAWDIDGMPGIVRVDGMAESIGQSIAVDADILKRTANYLCTVYRQRFVAWSSLLRRCKG